MTSRPGQTSHRAIERPRLTSLLDETHSQVVLLVAPAGYGKSTLARQWLAGGRRSAAWFRTRVESADVAALAAGLAKAAEGFAPRASALLQERLRRSHSPTAEAGELGTLLGEALTTSSPDTWIVIDDYHHLSTAPAAELFVEQLVSSCETRFLITSRVRPSWATARRFLYGEVIELGRNVLAMTHEEAARALPSSRQPRSLAGLVSLAEGWPAVIGMASLVDLPVSVAGDEMPAALHAYFAEELYQGIDSNIQWSLLQLSLAPMVDADVAIALFGSKAEQVLDVGCERGFLNRESGSYELHPLLRQFLRSKLDGVDPSSVRATVELLSNLFIAARRWDEAFELGESFELEDVVGRILNDALDDLLTQGRLSTLERWAKAARTLIPRDEIVEATEIELSFRKARWLEAEDRAWQLAQRLPARHPLASRILFRAAQVARLDDRQTEALELLDEARDRSITPADLRRVAWNRFITLTDMEDQELAANALDEFSALEPDSAEDALRLSQGRIQFAVRWGGLDREIERQHAMLSRLDLAVDPVVRSGFIQSYATALNLAAKYREALRWATHQITDSRRFGLDWVHPHALELQALAQIGLRDFAGARAALHTAQSIAEERRDMHAVANAAALRARISLADESASHALDILDSTGPRHASPGMEGEIRSLRSLALACLDRVEEAEAEARSSAEMTNHLEARGLRSYATAIIAHVRGRYDEYLPALEEAVQESRLTGNLDSFVCAYRAFPTLLTSIANHTKRVDEAVLRPLHEYDRLLAAETGLSPRSDEVPSTDLTEREREVLTLLRQGLSNQEIASTLWIAESTAKVHVRHILKKLGVRSRTAAALSRRDV
jgi:ATP/maltotriose-dependent transcriptional regulator MalT